MIGANNVNNYILMLRFHLDNIYNVDKEKEGMLFSHDIYIIIERHGEKETSIDDLQHIAYIWHGTDAEDVEDNDVIRAINASEIYNTFNHETFVFFRISQDGPMPESFIRLFSKTGLIIHKQGACSGEYESYESENPFDNNKRFYQIKQSEEEKNLYCVEVDKSPSSLNGQDLFVLIMDGLSFVWVPTSSIENEIDYAVMIAGLLVNDPFAVVKMREGFEMNEFWLELGGKATYRAKRPNATIASEPKLLSCKFSDTETPEQNWRQIQNISIDELRSECIIILDCGTCIYAWIGHNIGRIKLDQAFSIASHYLSSMSPQNENTNIAIIYEGNEPAFFTRYFSNHTSLEYLNDCNHATSNEEEKSFVSKHDNVEELIANFLDDLQPRENDDSKETLIMNSEEKTENHLSPNPLGFSRNIFRRGKSDTNELKNNSPPECHGRPSFIIGKRRNSVEEAMPNGSSTSLLKEDVSSTPKNARPNFLKKMFSREQQENRGELKGPLIKHMSYHSGSKWSDFNFDDADLSVEEDDTAGFTRVEQSSSCNDLIPENESTDCNDVPYEEHLMIIDEDNENKSDSLISQDSSPKNKFNNPRRNSFSFGTKNNCVNMLFDNCGRPQGLIQKMFANVSEVNDADFPTPDTVDKLLDDLKTEDESQNMNVVNSELLSRLHSKNDLNRSYNRRSSFTFGKNLGNSTTDMVNGMTNSNGNQRDNHQDSTHVGERPRARRVSSLSNFFDNNADRIYQDEYNDNEKDWKIKNMFENKKVKQQKDLELELAL